MAPIGTSDQEIDPVPLPDFLRDSATFWTAERARQNLRVTAAIEAFLMHDKVKCLAPREYRDMSDPYGTIAVAVNNFHAMAKKRRGTGGFTIVGEFNTYTWNLMTREEQDILAKLCKTMTKDDAIRAPSIGLHVGQEPDPRHPSHV